MAGVAIVVLHVLVGRDVVPHVGGIVGGVGSEVVLDLSHAVLRVAQVRDEQRQRGVHVGLGGGGVRGLGEPAALDGGLEERCGDGGVRAGVVVGVALHHPLRPQLRCRLRYMEE